MGCSVKIIVATHKKYIMPTDAIYLPLHVGAEGKYDEQGNELDLGYVKDNTGDNISFLNASFCELTGLYWAWKNLECDYIGLVHYRRHFCLNNRSDNDYESILTFDELSPYLGKIRVFTPNKRKYYIETLYSHYEHTHYKLQLDETKKIISDIYPDYIDSFDQVVRQRYGYMFNMMIMDREMLDSYCSWLFDILFALRERFEMPELSDYQGRYYGRIAEIIFNVWLNYQISKGIIKKDQTMEIPCVHMEKINWSKKIFAFLNAKFFGKKYKGSF